MSSRRQKIVALVLASLVFALGSSAALSPAVPSEGPTEASESIRTDRVRAVVTSARVARAASQEDLAPSPDTDYMSFLTTSPSAALDAPPTQASVEAPLALPRADRSNRAAPRGPPPSQAT